MKFNLVISILLIVLGGCKPKQHQKVQPDIQSEVISIDQARTLPIGSKVTVEGTVTVASGIFSSSIPFGYAVQDKTSGIYIVDSIPPMVGEFEMGELVEVTGYLNESNDLLIIREATAVKKGRGYEIEAKTVKTGSVNESNVGTLVHTSGIIDRLVNDHPYGYKVYINDGTGEIDIFVNTSTGFLGDTTNWKIDDSISVTGLSSQYDTIFEVDARIADDIRVISKN